LDSAKTGSASVRSRKEGKVSKKKIAGIIVACIIVIVVVAVAIALIGRAGWSSGGGAPWSPKPDIRLGDVRVERHWSLTLGIYHDVTYTLWNEGDAEGTATVEITGDYSGHLLTQTVAVPPHESVTKKARVDSNERDNDIYVVLR
jgi:hypothetical protein